MDRDEAALLLVVLGSGALLWFVGALTPPAATGDEQSAWRRVWLPAIPAATLFFVFVGFAVADPEGPQAIHATRLVATVPFAVASALVKTASLVRPARAAGASLADDATLLETRVRRLLTAETTVQRERSASSWTRVALALTLTVGAFVFGFVASAPFVSLLAGSP